MVFKMGSRYNLGSTVELKALITISSLCYTQDLSFRPLTTRRRYMWYKVNGEIRLLEFGLDNYRVLS
jgi:hypothetical protein